MTFRLMAAFGCASAGGGGRTNTMCDPLPHRGKHIQLAGVGYA